MSQTATKITEFDWEGIYIDDKLIVQNHSVSLEDVFQNNDVEISEMKTEQINLQKIGRTGLPQSLTELRDLLEFSETVQDHQSKWESKIQDALDKGDSWPTRDQICDRLNVTSDKFQVLIGIFAPDGIDNNQTAVGYTAVFSFVSTGVNEPTRYAPIDSDAATSYE